MPRQFLTVSAKPALREGSARFESVIELSYWEMFLMLLGREVETITAEGATVIRCAVAYSAFNLSAPRADDDACIAAKNLG